jgi:nanoRNase/pAp phosphatase (c-di-AMP/oligoRNAs hydrolase)
MTEPVESPATAADYAKRLLEFLERNRESLSPLLILPHDFPDPDALSAAFGLQHLAQQRFGIESRIAFGGVIGRVENRAMVKLLRIPVHPVRRTDFKRFKQVALVDTQPAFQNNPFPHNRRATIIIDQHASVEPPNAELTLVDTGCGATCVIIAQALLLAAVEIPARLATALAYGILSDTLDLFRATRPDVVETYLSVLHHSDMRALARIQNPPRSRSYFVNLNRCVREAVIRHRLIVSHLGPVKVPEMVAQMAEYLLTYDRATWAFCTGRYKGRLHISLRTSRPDAQAGEVLRDIVDNRKTAGGHRAIAGGSFLVGAKKSDEEWQQRELILQARLVKRLRLSPRSEFRKAF